MRARDDRLHRYTFAVGLTSAYLLEAESHAQPFLQFAEWCGAERGALSPPEGLPPPLSVERCARAFVSFFTGDGDGARPPIGPLDAPPLSCFTCAATGEYFV